MGKKALKEKLARKVQEHTVSFMNGRRPMQGTPRPPGEKEPPFKGTSRFDPNRDYTNVHLVGANPYDEDMGGNFGFYRTDRYGLPKKGQGKYIGMAVQTRGIPNFRLRAPQQRNAVERKATKNELGPAKNQLVQDIYYERPEDFPYPINEDEDEGYETRTSQPYTKLTNAPHKVEREDLHHRRFRTKYPPPPRPLPAGSGGKSPFFSVQGGGVQKKRKRPAQGVGRAGAKRSKK